MVGEAAIQAFKAGLRGELLRPQDDGYDDARKIFNAMIDKRPALIARCVGASDVIRAVHFAREKGLLVSVRSGGHNVAGNAVCDGGLMIDLSRMKGIRVDPIRRTVRAEPGLTLGEFDRETQTFGLATTLGIFSTTGMAGLTLGVAWAGWEANTGWPATTCSLRMWSPPIAACLLPVRRKTQTCFGQCGAVEATLASSLRSNIASILWGRCWPVCCSIRSRWPKR